MKALIKKLKTIKSIDIDGLKAQADVLNNKVLIDRYSNAVYIDLNANGLSELSSWCNYSRSLKDIILDHDKVSCENLLELCNSVSLQQQVQVLAITTFKKKVEARLLNVKSKRRGKNAFI